MRDERKHEKTKYVSKDYTFKKSVKCGRAVSPFKARHTVYLQCASVATAFSMPLLEPITRIVFICLSCLETSR